jgi:hypothetical protein
VVGVACGRLYGRCHRRVTRLGAGGQRTELVTPASDQAVAGDQDVRCRDASSVGLDMATDGEMRKHGPGMALRPRPKGCEAAVGDHDGGAARIGPVRVVL